MGDVPQPLSFFLVGGGGGGGGGVGTPKLNKQAKLSCAMLFAI